MSRGPTHVLVVLIVVLVFTALLAVAYEVTISFIDSIASSIQRPAPFDVDYVFEGAKKLALAIFIILLCALFISAMIYAVLKC